MSGTLQSPLSNSTSAMARDLERHESAFAPRRLSCLFLGRGGREEFASIVTSLQSSKSAIELRCCVNLKTALDWAKLPQFDPPDLIVLAEEYPQQCPRAELDLLAQIWPLSAWLGIYGSWCGGEPRTGRPWPRLIRVSATAFPVWFAQQIDLLRQNQEPAWRQPATYSLEERMLAVAGNALQQHDEQLHAQDSTSLARKPLAKQTRRHTLIVHSPCARQLSGLIESCEALGYSAFLANQLDELPHDVSPAILIVNCCGELAESREIVADWRTRQPNHPWVALLDFPREQDHELAARWGCAAALEKPLDLSLLAALLNNISPAQLPERRTRQHPDRVTIIHPGHEPRR